MQHGEKSHRVLIYITSEIQEVLPTGENQGSPKHAQKNTHTIDAETLEDAKKKLNEFIDRVQHG